MRHFVLSFAIIMACPFVRAEEVAVRSYPLPERGTFQLRVPESWKDSVAQPEGGSPPTITFTAKAGAPFKILVTPLWLAQRNLKPLTADELKTKVQLSADGMAHLAVEKTIEAKPLKGSTNIGYYFTATEREPKAGGFKFLNQGMVTVEDVLVAFTVFTNDGQDAVVTAALVMLSGAEKH